MELSEIRKLAGQAEGFLSDKEGELLYHLAKNCRGEGVIVEIGSWKGRSTIWLGQGSKAGKKVKIYAIDPHTGATEQKQVYDSIWTFEEFKKNVQNAKVDDLVCPIVKTSAEAAKDFTLPVELIFIDGAHEYEAVKLDFDWWYPQVIEGGIMAFHDTIWNEGPKKVVKELVYKSRNFRNVGLVDYITYAQKVRQNSFFDRVRNRYLLLWRNVYEVARKLRLPKPIRKAAKRILRFVQ